MELELKHLDFVNNGTVKLSRLPHWVFDNVKLNECQLCFSSTINEPYLRHRDVTFGMHQIIPYKRPLSDLKIAKVQIGEYFCTFSEHLQRMYPYEFIGLNPDKWSYRIIKFLLEYHFDIFNLIDNGLAIDINTLK